MISSCENMFPVKELKIPFPFGHIAAQEWGKEDGVHVLAIHGWQDNSGTFDKLIPLLGPDLHIVAIDVVGHGLSSHKPPGCYYHFMEKIIDIKLIIDFLKWDHFSLLGHSLGGALSLMFASVYPEFVDKLILLDVLKPPSVSMQKLPQATRKSIEKYLTLENKLKNPAPVYSEDEAVKRLVSAGNDQLTEQSARVLLKRGTHPSPCGKGVIFSRDIRVQTSEVVMLEHEVFKRYISNLNCELLIIKAKDFPFTDVNSSDYKREIFNLLKKTCKRFKFVEVDGSHYVHLNNPEIVAPLINDFFCNMNLEESKL